VRDLTRGIDATDGDVDLFTRTTVYNDRLTPDDDSASPNISWWRAVLEIKQHGCNW